eukprot:4530986-Pyramimonas_sp.AAC.1
MEPLMPFSVVSLMYGLKLFIGDRDNAFCQGDELKRESGRVFVGPCEGLNLEPGAIIELLAP